MVKPANQDVPDEAVPEHISPFLSLADCEFAERLAELWDVSPVARGDPSIPPEDRRDEGFMVAYKNAGGNPRRLNNYWLRRREGFISRHMEQARLHGESLYESDGVTPTRRHLALMMWAYSPDAR